MSLESWLAATENSTRTDFNNQGGLLGPAATGKSKVDVDSAAPAIWPGWSPPNVLLCPLMPFCALLEAPHLLA